MTYDDVLSVNKIYLHLLSNINTYVIHPSDFHGNECVRIRNSIENEHHQSKKHTIIVLVGIHSLG